MDLKPSSLSSSEGMTKRSPACTINVRLEKLISSKLVHCLSVINRFIRAEFKRCNHKGGKLQAQQMMTEIIYGLYIRIIFPSVF